MSKLPKFIPCTEMHPEEGLGIGDYSIIVSVERESLELWKLTTDIPNPIESKFANIEGDIINVSECHDLIASYQVHPLVIPILHHLIRSFLFAESLSDTIRSG